jgi:hypothetical protein
MKVGKNKAEGWRKKGVKRRFKRCAHPLSPPLHYLQSDLGEGSERVKIEKCRK